MAIGNCGRVLVQCELSISHGAIGKMREVQIARLLELLLLFQIAWIHGEFKLGKSIGKMK